MRRTVTASLLLLALAGCGSPDPAEQAYLAELQDRGSAIEIADPDGEIETGRAVCDILDNFKPEDRDISAHLLEQRPGFSRLNVTAAVKHLCPQVGVKRY